MKKCPYCGKNLHDDDCFCLFCMRRTRSSRKLPLYGKKKFLFQKILLLPILLVLGIGAFSFVFLNREDSGFSNNQLKEKNEALNYEENNNASLGYLLGKI